MFKFTLSLLQNNTQVLNLTCNRISKITLAGKMRNSLGNSSKLIADYLSECIIEERAIFYLWTLTVTNFSLQCNHWITQGGSWSHFMNKYQTNSCIMYIKEKTSNFSPCVHDFKEILQLSQNDKRNSQVPYISCGKSCLTLVQKIH